MANGKKLFLTVDPVHDKLCDFIERQGSMADRSDMTANASIVDDLRLDSLDCIELVMDLEEYYKIEISDEVAERWKTLGDVEQWLKKQPLAQRGAQ